MNQQRLTPHPTTGLTSAQVAAQKQRGLQNLQPKSNAKSTLAIIRDNTLTLFNLLNLAVAVCIALVGSYRNLLYMGIVSLNCLIGIVQEIRTRRTVAKLTLISSPKTTVVRDGNRQEVNAEELVQDDLIILEAGRQVCTDALLVQGEVEANEALLTGEANAILKEQGSLLLSGSFVVSGHCVAKVEHVGEQNYARTIESDAKRYKKVRSELMESLNKVVKFTSWFILPVAAVLFLRSYGGSGFSLEQAVVTTAAAVLGMLPKGLVLLTSVSLMVGVLKLGKRNTLVHELFCLETLSRVDVLCLDKTGTLTEGKMSVFEVEQLDHTQDIEALIGAFLAAQSDNNATIKAMRDHFKALPRQDVAKVFPFSSDRKYSAVNFVDAGTVVLGAPDILLHHEKTALEPLIARYEQMGARTLLFAHTAGTLGEGVPDDLTPLALVALRDPIRAEARPILDFFREQGVAIKLISGDTPRTLCAIAQQAGMERPQDYIDLSLVQDEAQVREAALKYSIFGRVSPQQKRLIIQALQGAGHSVAMVGDGANDVLALRDADCSIAMAAGTDAARNISQLVLLDNNFASLPHVVMEGRRVVNNITRTASLYLVKTAYSFLLSLLTTLTPLTYPFVPIQLTLIGTMMEGLPSFVLALEPNKERIQGEFFNPVWRRALPAALVIMVQVAMAKWLGATLGWEQVNVDTLCVYLTAITCALLLLAVCRPLNNLRRLLWMGCTGVMFLLAIMLPHVFHLAWLSWQQSGAIAIIALIGLMLWWLFTGVVNKVLDRIYAKPKTEEVS